MGAPRPVKPVTAVFAVAVRNPLLLRLELSWVAFTSVEWGSWVALLVYAYVREGAKGSSIIVAVQLVPCIVLSPFLSALPDRYRTGRVLFLSYIGMAVATGVLAFAIALGAPLWVVCIVASLGCLAMSVPRPAESALLPAIVRTPDELTAAHVASSWMENASIMLAPALTGLLIGIGGPALALAALAALGFAGAALIFPMPGSAPAPAEADAQIPSIVAEVRDGMRSLSHETGGRLLVAVLASQYVLIGALDVLYVTLAISVLGMGESGSGYLNSAYGIGGIIGGLVTALLIARRRLAPALIAGLVVAALALGVLGLYPTVIGAFLLLGVVGVSRSVLDATGRILLHRCISPGVLAKVFGVLEALMDSGLLVGTLLVPLLIGLSGPRAALLGIGAFFLFMVAATFRGLRNVDEQACVPAVEIHLLRSIPLFAPLPAPELEGLARALQPLRVPAGATVIREGEPGDTYFAIASGELEVSHAGRRVALLGRGEGFGEIALIEDVPRTATVRALADSDLYGLDQQPFILTLTGHEPTADRASSVVSRRLAELGELERSRETGAGGREA